MPLQYAFFFKFNTLNGIVKVKHIMLFILDDFNNKKIRAAADVFVEFCGISYSYNYLKVNLSRVCVCEFLFLSLHLFSHFRNTYRTTFLSFKLSEQCAESLSLHEGMMRHAVLLNNYVQ